MVDIQDRHIPDTISTEAREYLKSLEVPASLPESPAADDLEGWKKAWGENEALHHVENDALRFTFTHYA